MKVERNFKIRPRTLTNFKVKPAPSRSNRQVWFTAIPEARTISIHDLNAEQEYAFSSFTLTGGYRTLTATGATLQKKWAGCVKRQKLENFIAAFYKRPSRPKHFKPLSGFWRTVLLMPRRDLYFSVQPVRKRHVIQRTARLL